MTSLFNLLFIMQLYQKEDVAQCLEFSRKSLNGKYLKLFCLAKVSCWIGRTLANQSNNKNGVKSDLFVGFKHFAHQKEDVFCLLVLSELSFKTIFPWLKIMIEQKCETISPQVKFSVMCQLSIKGNFCYHERGEKRSNKTRE